MISDTLFVFALLCLLVAISEWLVQNTWLRHAGSALLVILLAAIVANVGIIPAGSPPEAPVAIYEFIFGYIAPLAIFLLLLPVNLKELMQAGRSMIVIFLIGSLGTALGVWIGLMIIDGEALLGDLYEAIGGMFVATYTGGAVNFNAVALHYDVVREGAIYGGIVAVDNVLTGLWMMVTIAVPSLFAGLWKSKNPRSKGVTRDNYTFQDRESLDPVELGLLLAIGFGTVWLSQLLASWLAGLGLRIPSIVIVTVLALVMAQVPALSRLKGTRLAGSFCIYLFLAVIGAFCDFHTLANMGQLGFQVAILATTTVLVHGLVSFVAAYLLRIDPAVAAVASQANVGGPPSALALARSIQRPDLVLPAVLIGSFGYAIGTFLGLAMAGYIL